MPGIPLPTTAQLTAVIEAIEPTLLQPLAQPLTWLRDRLDPFCEQEQSEEKKDQDVKEPLSEEEVEELVETRRDIKRGVKGEAIVPGKGKSATAKKMSTAVGQEKKRQKKEIKQRSRRQDEIDLMDHTYHHQKLDLPKGEQPYHSKTEQKEDSKPTTRTYDEKKSGSGEEQRVSQTKMEKDDHDSLPIRRTSQEKKSGSTQEQFQRQKLELATPQLEAMEVPTNVGNEPEVKIRLYPEEEARVARDLQDAMANNFFKLWPLKPDLSPEIDEGKKPDESREFKAPLSSKDQARKLELMNEWKSREEKDNKGRRVQERADYEDGEMMDILMSTSMFKPTLAPYIRTGKKIPTREEMLDEYESYTSVYEDALEVLPQASKENKNRSKAQGKRDNLVKKSRIPRRIHRTKSTKNVDLEEPAFAPKK